MQTRPRSPTLDQRAHSFLNDHRSVVFKMLKIVGIGYHDPSAKDARRRIASFFDEHLHSKD